MEATGQALEAEAGRTASRAAEAPAVYRECVGLHAPMPRAPSAPVVAAGAASTKVAPTFRSAWQNKSELQHGLKSDGLNPAGD